ncbi:MAG: hypothetical protein IPM24_18870 [Bryobacterales bacterium]|nr:hypothetical protein [Bryobacterales bacterium]
MRGRWMAVLSLCLAAGAPAADWSLYRTPHFEIYTDASGRQARDLGVALEQFRHGLGLLLGEPDLKTAAGVERTPVYLFRRERDATPYRGGGDIQRSAAGVTLVLAADALPGPPFFAAFARTLIEASVAGMPRDIEDGLVALVSTMETERSRIRIGAPVPPAERTSEWALVHLLAASPAYGGRLPALLRNLQRGMDEGPAWRNTMGKDREALATEAERHLAAGQFDTAPLNAAPIDPNRDYPERSADDQAVRVALDALTQEQERAAKAARLLAEAGTAVPDRAREALEEARELQPRAADPLVGLARLIENPRERVEMLETASALEPRRAEVWQALAEAHLAAQQFDRASAAWLRAEQSAATPAQREQMRQHRLAVEPQRLAFLEGERQRALEAERADIERVKQEAIARIRAAEARANEGNAPSPPGTEVVPWWDGPQPDGKVEGTIVQVDCLGRQARLIIQAGGKTVRLLIADASQVAIAGAPELALGCGRIKPRPVRVEYFQKESVSLGTTGEVASIEFR